MVRPGTITSGWTVPMESAVSDMKGRSRRSHERPGFRRDGNRESWPVRAGTLLEAEGDAQSHFGEIGFGEMRIDIDAHFQPAPSGKAVVNADTFVERLFDFPGILAHLPEQIYAQSHGHGEVMIKDFVLGRDAD